jgi:tight adherence protein B
MDPTALQIACSVLMGVAIALLIWGGRDWILNRYKSDVAWLRDTTLRFSPKPIEAESRMRMIYAVYLVILISLIFIAPHPLIAVALWVTLLTLPKLIVQMMWSQRRVKIDHQLPAAIAAMSNSIRAGLTLVQAVQRLSEQAPEPIRTEFQILMSRYTFGASLEASVRETKERLQLPNFNLFSSALLLNREMGGDVSETLSRISQSLDKLHQMRKTVEAHTSEGRTNIKVLLISPVVLLLMMSTIDGEGVYLLFSTSQGYAVLLIAGVLIAAGTYFASKITKQDI